MEKMIFVINGKAGSGKDTFVEYINRVGSSAISISTVDMIKQAATMLGWDGVKTPEARKFLSDLKDISTQFNEFPYRDACKRARTSIHDYVFIHCREPEEIDKIKKELNCLTVYINRDVPGCDTNHADINVTKYVYDIVVDNKGTSDDLYMAAKSFVGNTKNLNASDLEDYQYKYLHIKKDDYNKIISYKEMKIDQRLE